MIPSLPVHDEAYRGLAHIERTTQRPLRLAGRDTASDLDNEVQRQFCAAMPFSTGDTFGVGSPAMAGPSRCTFWVQAQAVSVTANARYSLWVQSCPMTGSAARAALGRPIKVVVCDGSQKEVVWVAARWHVAAMKDTKTLRYYATSERPRQSVRDPHALFALDPTVTVFVAQSQPRPAGVPSVEFYAGPKGIREIHDM